MTRLVGAVVLALLVAGGSDLLACGDKFLIVGRGTRFDRPGPARAPARILLYAPPGSRLAAAIGRLSVPDGLRKVGYSPAAVGDADGLTRALEGATWDLVVVDLDDRDAVRSRLRGDPPAIVAVASEGGSERRQDRDHEAQYVVKSPRRSSALLKAIDEALFDRAERTRVASKKGR